jgi:hypothetical protein
MNKPRLSITWPLTVLFVAYPIWWLLGVASFTWVIMAAPLTVALLWRGRTRAPVAFALWLAFVSWVFLSGLQITTGTTIATFAYRLVLYAVAGVLFLYVYNLPRSGQLDGKVLRILTIFWMVVVAGGYAGILLGSHTFIPPFDHLLPHGLRDKPFVQELVLPVFAQVQTFLGFPVPRPAAPFPYTNDWGGNMGVLTLVAFAALAAPGFARWRRTVLVVLFLSVVPMVFSLDRGMFLSLVVGLVYVMVRVAMRGHLKVLAMVATVAVIAVLVITMTPLGHLLSTSLSSTHGNSNRTRLSLYTQASAGVASSPFFGYGAPKLLPGQTTGAAIGTQGQLWMVLYSHGYPALIFFLGFFLAVLWQTRRARGTVGLCLHAIPIVALVQVAVYGWLPVELEVVMVAAALTYRLCSRPEELPGGSRTVAPPLVSVRPAAPQPAGRGQPRASAVLAAVHDQQLFPPNGRSEEPH